MENKNDDKHVLRAAFDQLLDNCLLTLRRPVVALTVVLIGLSTSFSAEAQIHSEDVQRISPGMKFLAQMENQYNPVDNEVRSADPFEIIHYDVPMKLVENLITEDLPQNIKESLVFKKDGELWVRWIPNPDDTMYTPQLKDYLKAHGIDPVPQHRFLAYRTSSRSVLIFDPKTGAEFSTKASTNHTRGGWTDKPERSIIARVVTVASRYVSNLLPRMAPHLVSAVDLAPEPGGFAIRAPGIDQGMLIRTYPFKNNRRLIPIFSLFHEEFGKKCAKANGYDDPLKFTTEVLFPLWIKSMVQFSMTTGLMSNSAHGQNYLVETDENLKLTGKIVHRDFTDSRLNPYIVRQKNGPIELIKTFLRFNNSANEVLKYSDGGTLMYLSFSPVQNNLVNSWFPAEMSTGGVDVYQQAYDLIEIETKKYITDRLGPGEQVDIDRRGLQYHGIDGRYETHFGFLVRIRNSNGHMKRFTNFPVPLRPKESLSVGRCELFLGN